MVAAVTAVVAVVVAGATGLAKATVRAEAAPTAKAHATTTLLRMRLVSPSLADENAATDDGDACHKRR